MALNSLYCAVCAVKQLLTHSLNSVTITIYTSFNYNYDYMQSEFKTIYYYYMDAL